MQYRKLGRTDVLVSTVAMGCWAIADPDMWGPQDESDAVEAVETALEAGITFFDTAEIYGAGRSEELLGRVLAGRRDQVVIASKVSPARLALADLKASCEASLRRLRTDYIDLYQIHWPNRDVPIADTMGALEDLKAEGKVRVIGCSNFGPRDLRGLLDAGRSEVDQVAYNMLWRGAEEELAGLCVDSGVSILPYSPIAQGLLTGKFASPDDVPPRRARSHHFSSRREHARHGGQGAEAETFEAIRTVRAICEEAGVSMAGATLAWLLSRPAVTSVLAGARNADQARTNAAGGDLELPAEVLDALTSATDSLKARFGGALDMWETEGKRIR
ncbi:MAG: aldo/keto reductase [Candidatus Brocadiia bacterium]|jgi:aryl-alcohol dehydrogenase-like predicted oxidoreductase|nr:aldo/keto reductase [Candidatus Brocadiia bacterium]